MDPLTLATIGGVAGAARGVGQGLTTAIGGTALYNRDDRRRHKELLALQQAGQLGLTDVEKQRIQSDQAVERGGMLRTQQSQSQQAQQALANQNMLSGREMFLADVAGADAEADLRGQQAQAMAQQDIAKREAQLIEIQRLADQKRARQQAVRAGLTQALTLGIFGGVSGFAEEKLGMERAIEYDRQQDAENRRIAYSKSAGGSSLSEEESANVPRWRQRYSGSTQ